MLLTPKMNFLRDMIIFVTLDSFVTSACFCIITYFMAPIVLWQDITYDI